MAISNLVLSSLLTFFSLLFFTVVSNEASINDHVSTICPKTTNQPFCISVLKSAGSTDLKGLATYALNISRTNADKSSTLAKSLAAAEPDPLLKERYLSCSENYDEVIGNIENAQKYLVVGDFNGVNIVTSSVMTAVDDCQDNFKQPTAEVSSLLDNCNTLDDLCSIILIISNLLLS